MFFTQRQAIPNIVQMCIRDSYNSIKAEDINSRAIELYIDDQKFERDDSDKIWMSDNMAVMVLGDLVNDLFRCTVALSLIHI